MQIKKCKRTIEEGKLYTGQIAFTEQDEINERIRIYVEIESLGDEIFYVSLKTDDSDKVNSKFTRFFEDMEAFSILGDFELEELEGLMVEVSLRRGTDGLFYVKQLYLIENPYEDEA